jgi:hypothetical protein
LRRPIIPMTTRIAGRFPGGQTEVMEGHHEEVYPG